MTRNDRKDAGTGNSRGENRGATRRSHSIRFADSEWNLIERAAARQGVPAGEFARSGALAASEERIAELPAATLSPGHLALIESTWRMAYVLATLNREQLLDTERGEDLDELVAEARLGDAGDDGRGAGVRQWADTLTAFPQTPSAARPTGAVSTTACRCAVPDDPAPEPSPCRRHRPCASRHGCRVCGLRRSRERQECGRLRVRRGRAV